MGGHACPDGDGRPREVPEATGRHGEGPGSGNGQGVGFAHEPWPGGRGPGNDDGARGIFRLAGAPATADGNGEQPEGVARTEINLVDFARHSAADAYLGQARHRPNLTVVTDAFAERLVFDGRRCTSVEYVLDGQRRTERAGREVALAAGPIGSPQLLLVSGIGPAEQSRRLGIDVAQHLPGVG
ncbi:GMC family oxidoreductase N-terminal domain-containing protein [Streptomyces sp. NPDC004393]